MAHIEYAPTAEATAFAQTMGETLQALTDSKKQHLRNTAALKKSQWAETAMDNYHERASNPKVAKHSKQFLSMVAPGSGNPTTDLPGCFNNLNPNEGEYMAGWRQQALTVPDRSIAALKHPKWLAGDAFPRMFPQPSVELMGPHHPVKDQIKKQVAHMRQEVAKKGPIVGPKSAKERLELKAKDEEKHGAGLPRWKPTCCYNRPLNPLLLKKETYLIEKEKWLAARPARCDPKLPQMYTRAVGDVFNPLQLLGS